MRVKHRSSVKRSRHSAKKKQRAKRGDFVKPEPVAKTFTDRPDRFDRRAAASMREIDIAQHKDHVRARG